MKNIFIPLRRGVILKAIEGDPARELSNELLQRSLKDVCQACSIAEVNEHINWLENRGYVKTGRLESSSMIKVKILRPGIEVATGFVRAEGIDVPLED
jgi:hypothetical protein